LKRKLHSTGQVIPASGIYRVTHSQHNVPEEVTLLKGEKFPRCAKCRKPIEFELIHAAPDPGFRVALYELPELPDGENKRQGKKAG